MSTRKKETSADLPEKTFEEDLKRLEDIVSELESADTPIEQLMKKFEEGMGLVRRCNTRLKEVERKVEVLLAGADAGSLPTPQPFADDHGRG